MFILTMMLFLHNLFVWNASTRHDAMICAAHVLRDSQIEKASRLIRSVSDVHHWNALFCCSE